MSFRENVLSCLGKLPEKAELNVEIRESEDKGTHLLQRVYYNVEPGERVNAYLLLPKKMGAKNPAIVASHQHACEFYIAKSEPAGLNKNSMYHYGLELCLRGYVVLCPDHLCFEDRRPSEYERMENSALDSMAYEDFTFTRLIMEGKTLQGKYVSDLTRAIDVLETLDFVDKDRIGAIGHSLGGQETLWLTWFDERIKAAVSSCGFSQIRSILREGINHNKAVYTFGILNYGDVGDLVADLAPRPFMMTNGSLDVIFPLDGVKEIAAGARARYAEKGAADNYKAVVFEGKHAFPKEVRQEAYDFLDRFLK
jgi:dienelactone hydrolase